MSDEDYALGVVSGVGFAIFLFVMGLQYMGVSTLVTTIVTIVVVVGLFLSWVRYENAKLASEEERVALKAAEAMYTVDGSTEHKKSK